MDGNRANTRRRLDRAVRRFWCTWSKAHQARCTAKGR